MPNHVFLSRALKVKPLPDDGLIEQQTFTVRVNRPGKVLLEAKGIVEILVPNAGGATEHAPKPGQGGTKKRVPLVLTSLSLIDPDGQRFSKSVITIEDLDRYRDARGVVRSWRVNVGQQSTDGKVIKSPVLRLVVGEGERPSLSGLPLINQSGLRIAPQLFQEFPFDLFRLGRLTAKLSPNAADLTVSLIDPDGVERARGAKGSLETTIKQRDLGKSRGPGGARRLWKIRVDRPVNTLSPAPGWTLVVEVIGTVRIAKAVLQKRLDLLAGPEDKPNITLALNFDGTKTKPDGTKVTANRLTLTINDEFLAETLGVHGVLKTLSTELNPPDLLESPQVGHPYVLLEDEFKDTNATPDRQVKAKNVVVQSLALTVGAAQLQPNIGLPAILLRAKTSGSLKVDVNNFDDAEMVAPLIQGEVILTVANGRVRAMHTIDRNSLRYGGEEGRVAFRDALTEARDKMNRQIPALDDIVGQIFNFFVGGRFQFTQARHTNDAIEFDYVAGNEPERAPNPGYLPRGVPPAASPQFASPNLSKIDHIVVLMMENRSFDHMLGSLVARNPQVEGLSEAVLKQFNAKDHEIRSLANAAFADRLRFPLSVGHSFTDTAQQIAGGMRGFVTNFQAIHSAAQLAANKVKPDDVLGFYPLEMLFAHDFLSQEYAVCDHYFSSHPGPTLPNRMFSLTGELQRDLYGEPQPGDSFTDLALARETNIFDILEMQGVTWRQYESFPSVAMLRFFARFAGDDTNIRSMDRFKEDVKNANATTNRFPSVVFLDPQFHTSSHSGGELEENDDHPPADLFRGQTLIHDVYSALIANPAVWNKTLFVVTYDEHGGFFDHVVPPVAEGLRKGNLPQINVNYGVRVPTLLASPWIPKGLLVKDVLDHASILKSILVRFCASAQPFLSDRVLWANDLGVALTLSAPRPVVQPTKPEPRNKAMAATADGSPASVRLNVPMSELTAPNADWHVLIQVVGRAIRGKP